MNYLLEFRMYKNKQFWQDVDKTVEKLIEDNNFIHFWDLQKKYPDILEGADDAHDRVLIPLHNSNRILKRIKFGEWIWMWLIFIRYIKDIYDDKGKGFYWWINNVSVKLYRGLYSYYDEDTMLEDLQYGLEKNEYKSFTFDKDMAKRFTQSGWGSGAWVDERHRNGIIYEVEILPKNIHIVTNEQGEKEAVLNGPLNFDKYYIVSNNNIKGPFEISFL